MPKIALFYALWYPMQWLGELVMWPRFRAYGPLATHFRFAARASRRLARSIFHGMLRFGPKLEQKQAFLFRAVDVALELFAMTATLLRAHGRREAEPHNTALALRFARDTEMRVDDLLRDMWRNDDAQKCALAQQVLRGTYTWLEAGTMGIPYSIDDMRPETMEAFFARRTRETNQRAADIRHDSGIAPRPSLESTPDGGQTGEPSRRVSGR